MKKETSSKEHSFVNISFRIPMRSIWSFLITIFIGYFAYLSFRYLVIPELSDLFNEAPETLRQEHLVYAWYPIISYLLVSLGIIFVTRIFKELKPPRKNNEWFGLIGGLIGGLIFGSIGGLIVGLIVGLTEEFKDVPDSTENEGNIQEEAIQTA